MEFTVNSVNTVLNPVLSIRSLLHSFGVQGSEDLIRQLLGAFHTYLKVTKKILQRNYLQKLFKLGLHTAHSMFVTKKMMRSYKTNERDWNYNYRITSGSVMAMCVDDSVRDLEWMKKIARDKSTVCFDKIRLMTNRMNFKKFKDGFFELVLKLLKCNT